MSCCGVCKFVFIIASLEAVKDFFQLFSSSLPCSGQGFFSTFLLLLLSILGHHRCHFWYVLAIYFEQTDHVGHESGPFSTELNQVIQGLDRVMSDLVDRLSDPGLSDVNLLIFSDHGMTKVVFSLQPLLFEDALLFHVASYCRRH